MPAVPYDVNASLLQAAACSENEISTLINSLTLERAAPSILDEILARRLPCADLAGTVLFELRLGRMSAERTLSFRDGRVEVTRSRADSPGGTGTRTVMTRLKELLNGLHYPEHEDTSVYQPPATNRGVSAVLFYRNIVFIEKGLNTEIGPPEWTPRVPV
ncbi:MULTISPECIES: hypothetical protein [unclassified Parafrankia]|uniref:hypothetical protein n=1 Tax=unclassified Parafrankia TaxID=2994368 RepID=UPI000DA5288F|nr:MULTISPECIES: hypothetical protein [unclassified Parafrankia]TCJ40612.1 hypothetical protein E0504_04645 [Parafrankia sp. BMG5.11]SQD94117.1 hypothetical protein FMEAI12_2280010 [Parafrankia sp. Ea1.12]